MSVFNMAASPSTSLDEDILLNGTFFAAKKLNINGFKDLQLQAILSVLRGKDTFVSLPTGYGKSAIFQAIPLCKDHLRAHAQESGYAAASCGATEHRHWPCRLGGGQWRGDGPM